MENIPVSYPLAAAFAALLSALTPSGFAQSVAFAGGTYEQDFNGLPNNTSGSYTATTDGPFSLSSTSWSTPTLTTTELGGWQIFETGGSSGAILIVGDGTGTTSGALSYGAGGSEDRALGSLGGSARIMAFGVVLQNTSGSLIDEVTISYTGEQWRLGRSGATPAADTLSFGYKIGTGTDISGAFASAAELNFISPVTTGTAGALDGNNPTNQDFVTGTLMNLSWAQGDYLVLRWTDFNETGNDHGLAIDTFTLTAATSAIPEPSTYAALAGGLALGVTVLRRRRVRR